MPPVSRYRSASDGRSMDLVWAPKAASTAIALNTLLTLDATNGRLTPAVTASLFVVGVSMSTILATDPNFANTEEIQYDAARDGDEFIMAVDSAATAGFVPGVERGINSAGQIRAIAPAAGVGRLVRVKRVLLATNQAVVELITNADSQNI